MYTRTPMHIHTHIYIYIHMYIHIYIHAHLELGGGSQEIKTGVCIEKRCQALLPVRARHELVLRLAQEMEQSHLYMHRSLLLYMSLLLYI
jgi:hypothetical protein